MYKHLSIISIQQERVNNHLSEVSSDKDQSPLIFINSKFGDLRAPTSISCGDRYGHLDTSNSEICPLVMILSTIILVPFFATKETLAPLANDPIIQKRSIRSFRHLECQNPSIISEDIGRARMVQQFQRRNRGGTAERRNGGVQLSQMIRYL